MKIKSQICKQSHKHDGIGASRIEMFPFSSDSAYDCVIYDLVKTRLSESEIQCRSGRISQSQSSFPHFVIGLVLPLLLVTLETLIVRDRLEL